MNNINELICFCRENRIDYKENQYMKNYTTFKIGGPADLMVFPKNEDEISAVSKYCHDNQIKLSVIGNGSNLLVSDNGIDGCVMVLGKNMSEIKLISPNQIFAESGASLSSVCIFAMKNGLSGLEFAYGIPGSVGGAVRMNAGAYGGEIKDTVKICRYISSADFSKKEIDNTGVEFSYRHSVFCTNSDIVSGAVFTLNNGSEEEIKAKMDELIQKRKKSQPLEFPSGGSTFKRPEGAFAAQLIDECGLKGYHVGDAYVSEKHAGFVINKGSAKCADVLKLIEDIKNTVKREKGFNLETEIEIVGK